MLKGTVLVSPEDKHPYFAYFVKNQIQDNRPTQNGEPNIANELLSLVCQKENGEFERTSPAKLLDLCPPTAFAKVITPPAPSSEDQVMEWAYEHQTEPLLAETEKKVKQDNESRRQYLEDAFQQVILDVQGEINELQGKALISDDEKTQMKLQVKEQRLADLKQRKKERLEQMEHGAELFAIEPKVMGCAYVVPLNQVEYRQSYGMSRDDEVEHIAMQKAMEFEQQQGREPKDVSADNVGYDIRSLAADGSKRYIEVKGRNGTDGVMLSENEMNRLAQLGNKAWLYIVTDCATQPQLHLICNPAQCMSFEKKTKGVQFFLSLAEWQAHEEA